MTETHEGLDEGFRRSLEAETQQGAHRIMLELETADGDEMHLDEGFAVRGAGEGNRLYVGNLSMRRRGGAGLRAGVYSRAEDFVGCGSSGRLGKEPPRETPGGLHWRTS